MFSALLKGNTKTLIYIFLTISILSCKQSPPLFQQIKSSYSGILFNNQIIENDSINQLDNGNIFNGGGVGIGDFNNDGLADIYFTGSLVSNRLYINKGNFSFRDITEESNTDGEGKWCRGVAVVDINNDGKQDIYLSVTISNNPEERKNILYINQGSDARNIPHFVDMAEEYGLDDNSHTTQAAFFDYDNDGDLDVYLVVNEINDRNSPYIFHSVIKDGSNSSTGRLYRNDWDNTLGHPVFKEVSEEAGILTEGYGNQASITDINRDGWKDIYVSNDYLSNDLLWINNKNGTFSENLSSIFKHTSNSAMGNDIGDINNDGLLDFITLDMNPEDNFRKKMMLPPASYQFYQNSERYNYNYQYVRNTLQLNQGSGSGYSDMPLFSEIAYYAGIEATDWSWTPLLADFNNDGFKDLFIANGFPRDITDRDFGMYRMKAWKTSSKADILKQIPEVRIHNYMFINNSDLTFTNMSDSWGLTSQTFSNGSAYADFDNDGDLDLVINNINDEALLYRNNFREQNSETSHFIAVRLIGDSLNINGLGAWIEIYYGDGEKQVWENAPQRGYISTVENIAHFGLGSIILVDSMVIKWQNGKMENIKNLSADNYITLNINDATVQSSDYSKPKQTTSLFEEITASLNIGYVDKEIDFVDFNIQKLIPHKFSEYGPALAAGDLNGDGLDDLIAGGSSHYSASLFLQNNDGTFRQRSLLPDADIATKEWDDSGILIFDADSDGDNDIFISSGGYENDHNSNGYNDHLYLNDGRAAFNDISNALPLNVTSKSCVRAADFDKDGDLDIFLAGRVDPWNYPKPVSSFLYRNDSEKGVVKFTDITQSVSPGLLNIGMVSDAIFTDFNNDGWPDLVLAGEWMPITFLINQEGIFRDITSQSGLSSHTGWWNTLSAGDFDNDGDIDYIAGNLGLNSYYRSSHKYPVSIYAGDFDNNGNYDLFPSLYIIASQQDTVKSNYPAHGRDDAIKQMIQMRSGFQNYKSYATATIDKLFTEEQARDALILKATDFRSAYCRNDGNNTFSLFPLPAQAQFSVLNGMITDDFDQDGNLDILINGNDYGTDVLIGRYDALNGLLLKGDGRGKFMALKVAESGVIIPGNGKAMVKLRSINGSYLVASAENRGPLRIFELKEKQKNLSAQTDEIYAELMLNEGKKQKQEFYYGSSFLSQSARFIRTGKNIRSVTFVNNKNEKRTIQF